LAESANRTKKGGQELIGGLDVRVRRNYFGRQTESFEAALHLPFLSEGGEVSTDEPFRAIFIRAPVVETLLSPREGEQVAEADSDGVVIAPSRREPGSKSHEKPVEIMATLPGRSQALKQMPGTEGLIEETGDIVAVLQDNVFGTSFHPELTNDTRIHRWWLKRVSALTSDR
jgi:pyridoxal 5'-phosphate synthase pdxT subunit